MTSFRYFLFFCMLVVVEGGKGKKDKNVSTEATENNQIPDATTATNPPNSDIGTFATVLGTAPQISTSILPYTNSVPFSKIMAPTIDPYLVELKNQEMDAYFQETELKNELDSVKTVATIKEHQLIDTIYDEEAVIDSLIDEVYHDASYIETHYTAKKEIGLIAGSVCGAIVLGIILTMLLTRCFRARRVRAAYRDVEQEEGQHGEKEPLYSDYAEISAYEAQQY